MFGFFENNEDCENIYKHIETKKKQIGEGQKNIAGEYFHENANHANRGDYLGFVDNYRIVVAIATLWGMARGDVRVLFTD